MKIPTAVPRCSALKCSPMAFKQADCTGPDTIPNKKRNTKPYS